MVTGCWVPALTTSPVVSLAATRLRPRAPLGGEEGRRPPASPAEAAAGGRVPTRGFCHPTSQAGPWLPHPGSLALPFSLGWVKGSVGCVLATTLDGRPPLLGPSESAHATQALLLCPPHSLPGLLSVWVCGGRGGTEEVGVGLTSSTQRVLAQQLHFPCPAWPSAHPTILRQRFSFPTGPLASFPVPQPQPQPPPCARVGSGGLSHPGPLGPGCCSCPDSLEIWKAGGCKVPSGEGLF